MEKTEKLQQIGSAMIDELSQLLARSRRLTSSQQIWLQQKFIYYDSSLANDYLVGCVKFFGMILMVLMDINQVYRYIQESQPQPMEAVRL